MGLLVVGCCAATSSPAATAADAAAAAASLTCLPAKELCAPVCSMLFGSGLEKVRECLPGGLALEKGLEDSITHHVPRERVEAAWPFANFVNGTTVKNRKRKKENRQQQQQQLQQQE